MTTGSLTSNAGYTPTLAPSSASGPNGDTASIGYDTNARPSSTDSPSGAHTAITYNDTQSPPVISAVVSSSNTNTHWSRKTMDGFGRTIKTETGSGGTPGTTILSVVDTIYAPCGCSPLGKLWKTSMPHLPNATQYWTTYTYDGSGRTLRVQSPDGSSTTTYAYSGNTVTVTDPAGKWKTFTMDAMSNLTTVLETDPLPTPHPVTTAYTYDMLSHLTQVSMIRNGTTQTRSFNYNTSSTTVGAHLLSATNPENGTVSYTYNSDHTLNTKTDAKGQVFTYTYDGYKRPLTVSVAGTTLRTYSYDTNPYDGTYSQYSAGRLTAIQYAPINYEVYFGSPQGSTTFTDMFTYTQPGQIGGKRLRVTKVQPYLNGQNHTQTAVGDLNLGYGYNKEGKLSIATYPTDAYGHMPYFNYSYDPMMRPAGMTDQGGATVVSGATYGPSNELTQMSYNGGTETRVYNSMLQLTSISGLGQSINYTFPAAGSNAGKILSQTDTISGETVNYLYD
jgi:YD repeat-containing protein